MKNNPECPLCPNLCWDAQTGQELLTLKAHTKFVNSVTFSPDGRTLASASNDETVKVWDAQTGKELLRLNGHAADVHGVATSADGLRPQRAAPPRRWTPPAWRFLAWRAERRHPPGFDCIGMRQTRPPPRGRD